MLSSTGQAGAEGVSLCRALTPPSPKRGNRGRLRARFNYSSSYSIGLPVGIDPLDHEKPSSTC